ncbi:hypothetical protein C496_05447 [Natronorubrum tibetense GA33]|uniref:Uncharacterized protein n=1 Tax=Natronorubrum tibetense GA33 TaxID=1114856 RepID=L9VZR7_9EURY|nr:hypothetical protein C496_05447 [Natronorubrum tibetense GA33]
MGKAEIAFLGAEGATDRSSIAAFEHAVTTVARSRPEACLLNDSHGPGYAGSWYHDSRKSFT